MDLIIDPEFQSLIPPLTPDELGQLEANLLNDGCRDPLVMWQGILLDGHNRYALCTRHSLPFQTVEAAVSDRNAAKVWIIRNQFGRRNLSAYQRSVLALQLKDTLADQARERQRGGQGGILLLENSPKANTRQELATVAGVSDNTIHKVEFIEEHAPPEIKAQAATGDLSIHQAYQQTRQAVARERVPEPVQAAIPLPTGRYRCLVLDPPWPVQKIERDERPDQGVALDYPTMTLDEIAALPVADLAEPDGCHLYLWTTHHFLPDALALVGGWGFRYQCLLTWVKPTGMTPYSWMYNTEHVIFARYGALRLERLGLKLAFEAPVIRHSQKPDVFYERAMQASPGPRLEMFARQRRDGFTAWGSDRGLEDSSYVS